jgi:hypothetical protein
MSEQGDLPESWLDLFFGEVRILPLPMRKNPDGSMSFWSRIITTGYKGRLISSVDKEGLKVWYE